MFEGIWIVVGAIIAAIVSILTTRLRQKGRQDYFDDKAIQFLKAEIGSEGLQWSDIRKLGASIGLDELETKQLVFLAGIRPDKEKRKLWKNSEQTK
jgi:hypothetical protein